MMWLQQFIEKVVTQRAELEAETRMNKARIAVAKRKIHDVRHGVRKELGGIR